MDYGYLNRPTCRGCDNGSRAFLYAACGWNGLSGSRAVGLKEAVVAAARHRQAMILAALVTTFAGGALFIDRPHGAVLGGLCAPCSGVGGRRVARGGGARPPRRRGQREDPPRR